MNEIRDFISDNATILTMTEEELKNAKKYEDDPQRVLAVIRRIRNNKAAEIKSTATYAETKTLEAIIDAIRRYRAFKAETAEQIDKILADKRYSSEYRTSQINELNDKLKSRTSSDRESTLKLLDEIIKDRTQFDRSFFSDSKRLDTANNAINVLKNAGKNISIEDFIDLTNTFYGDAAASRYVYAAVKGENVAFISYLESMAIRTENAFDKSKYQLESLFSGEYNTYQTEMTLLEEAAAVGIALTVVNYSEPVASENRIKSIEPQYDEAEALEMVRKSMNLTR